MSRPHAVSVLLEDHLVTFTRAVGLLRRRNLPVCSIAVGPTATPGLSRLTVMMQADEATADRAVKHLQKMIGVREAITFPAAEGVTRELALVKVRAPQERLAELRDVVQRYDGTVVGDSAEALVVEVSGPEPFVLACLRDLEQFEVLEVARTGAIALGTGAAGGGEERPASSDAA
jgi:acetolactate synthase-1/3 small subunit